jgi:NAD(P)-dependent dehydrogenase (short-subunit alcohol dehydrogenase family)
VRRIQAETGNPRVEFLLADLSSQAQIRVLAADFTGRHERLDVLVNNAAGVFLRRQLSADGIEMTLALNHLSYFLLTNLLLDTLKASAPARIVIVSSNAHLGSPVDLNDLQLEGGYSILKAYNRSKFANILFAYELARRLAGTRVTANALHPGLVITSIAKHNGRLAWWGWRAYARWRGALTAEQGASPCVYLAGSPEVEGVSGAYFVKKERRPSDPATFDESLALGLWQASARLTGLT